MDKISNTQKLIAEKSNEIAMVLSIITGPKYFFSCYAFSSVFGEMDLENRWEGSRRSFYLQEAESTGPFSLSPSHGSLPFPISLIPFSLLKPKFLWSFVIHLFGWYMFCVPYILF